MITENTILWDVMPCSSIEVHQCFGGTYYHCLQGQRVRPARNVQEADSKLVACLTLQLWKFFRTTQHYRDRGSSVSIARVWIAEESWFNSRQVQEIYLFSNMSEPALRTTQPPIQWVSWAVSLGVKQSGREADHSLPCDAEVKNV
jgi:hypothetical protein